MKIWLILLGVVAILITAASNPKVPAKQVMGGIYEALQNILPYGLSEEKFADQKNREVLRRNIKTLAEQASILPVHTQHQDTTFKHIGTTLALDAKEIQRRFDEGRIRQALFLLGSITDHCVACHSRFPAPSSNKAEGLVERVDMKSLTPEEKARLYLITRQFDKAMVAYRDLILSDEYRTEDILMEDWVDDYLLITVRVKRDFDSAKTTLTKLRSRQGLPAFAQNDLDSWIASIDQLKPKRHLKPTLENARGLIQDAKKQSEHPMDRQGQIHYLLASSLLHEYLATQPKGESAAEGYFLLDLSESMAGKDYLFAQNEFYLEAAIRSAPRSGFAKKAFHRLEEAILFGYSGSSGVHIPDDVRAHLDELRKLVRDSKTN
jgi:hypothetical protein